MKKSRLGSNPFAEGGINSLIKETTDQPEVNKPNMGVTEPRLPEETPRGLPRPQGRPTTTRRDVEKTSQIGLPENYTRATFIMREDLLEKLKDYAYTDRRSLKDVVNEMLSGYLEGKEVIERRK